MGIIFKIRCLRTKIKYWYLARYDKEFIKDLEDECKYFYDNDIET